MNHDSLLDSLRHADVVPSVSGSVAQQLLGMLLGEHMSAGDRLPSERFNELFAQMKRNPHAANRHLGHCQPV